MAQLPQRHLPCNICPGVMCQLSRIDVYLISYLSELDQILEVVLLTPLRLGFSARLKIWQVSNCNIELTVYLNLYLRVWHS